MATYSDAQLDSAIAELMPGPPPWRESFEESANGNLWRRWRSFVVTVFPDRYRSGWRFCIAGKKGFKHFSEALFKTQVAAMDAVEWIVKALED